MYTQRKFLYHNVYVHNWYLVTRFIHIFVHCPAVENCVWTLFITFRKKERLKLICGLSLCTVYNVKWRSDKYRHKGKDTLIFRTFIDFSVHENNNFPQLYSILYTLIKFLITKCYLTLQLNDFFDNLGSTCRIVMDGRATMIAGSACLKIRIND